MMIAEFIQRTGFEPTAEEYIKIEEDYCKFEGDKEAFFTDFCEHGIREMAKARGDLIARLKSQILELEREFHQHCQRQEQKIAELQEALDQAQKG